MKNFKFLAFGLALLLGMLGVWFAVDNTAIQEVSNHFQVFQHNTDVVYGATVSLASFGRKERQQSNLGGLAKIVLFGASDFTADWPVKSGITAGAITGTTIPVKAGVTGAVVTFDTGTARFKHGRKGKLGYQVYEHELSAELAGYEATQLAAIDKTFNEGAVAICFLRNGKRFVVGASYSPLVFEDDGDSGGKSDDGAKITIKAKIEDAVDFACPELAAGVTIALPA